eukprot:GHVU01136905.1.p1 GENE.GHVU01136905.1~~GHVU01136905.1.p1  ORF type:complete len:320 (+),score=57.14 GHVU01136905.1:151-1110(+)
MATVFPNVDFDPEARAVELKEAMKGLGTEEETIIRILTDHSNEQRQTIRDTFKTCYGEDLIDELKSELSGDFEQTILALMQPPRVYDAHQLRKAMKGLGTDEATLIEIMCSRDNLEIEVIKAVYEEEFSRNLEADLVDETSGHFKRVLVAQCNAGRDLSIDIDLDKAREDAQNIFDAGEGQLGTDEAAFMLVLCSRSYCQLRATFDIYQEIAEKDIEDSIKDETSGNLRDGMLAIVKCARGRDEFFAERLYDSMKGLGTDEATLIRVIVSRSEVDLRAIKRAFFIKYEGQTLKQFIEDDCSGDFKRVLLALCGEAVDED